MLSSTPFCGCFPTRRDQLQPETVEPQLESHLEYQLESVNHIECHANHRSSIKQKYLQRAFWTEILKMFDSFGNSGVRNSNQKFRSWRETLRQRVVRVTSLINLGSSSNRTGCLFNAWWFTRQLFHSWTQQEFSDWIQWLNWVRGWKKFVFRILLPRRRHSPRRSSTIVVIG